MHTNECSNMHVAMCRCSAYKSYVNALAKTKMKRKIQVHDLHGTYDGCWPLLICFLAPFSLSFPFPFRWVWLFCIDETINELIMTNDQGAEAHRSLSDVFAEMLLSLSNVDVAVLWLFRESDKYALAMPMFCIGSQSD